eukprot:CFRG2153T1
MGLRGMLKSKLKILRSDSEDEDSKPKVDRCGVPACGDITIPVPATTCIDPEGRVTLTYSPHNEIKQPLKGWMTYGGRDKSNPFMLEYTYFSMHELMTDWGQYNWAKVDSWLDEVADRGRHGVFRVVVDYPSTYPDYRCPDFLGVKTTKYCAYGDDGKYPDYTNANLRRAIPEFVRAMGAKYDGDRRLASIQAGLLGYWGEWHMLDGFPDAQLQDDVIRAFSEAFQQTHIQVSVDAAERSNCGRLSLYRMGYHDDSYAGTTLRQAVPALQRQRLCETWKRVMNGGELTYCNEGNQKEFYLSDTGNAKFDKAIEALPVSWLLNDAYKGYKDAERLRSLNSAAKMGYQIHMASVLCARDGVHMVIVNRGTTPFYYPVWITGTCDKLDPQVEGNTPFEQNEQLRFLLPGHKLNMVIPLPLDNLIGNTLQLRLMINSTMLLPNQVIHWANSEDHSGALTVYLPITQQTVAYGLESMPTPAPAVISRGMPIGRSLTQETTCEKTNHAQIPVTAVMPSAFTVELGRIDDSQTVKNLTNKVSTGDMDDWDQYIEFECTEQGGRKGFNGEFTFNVAAGAIIQQMECNYRGQRYKSQPWELDIFDIKVASWVNVWKNTDVKSWKWSASSVDLPEGSFESDGVVRVRITSPTTNDAGQLDYLALLVSQ